MVLPGLEKSQSHFGVAILFRGDRAGEDLLPQNPKIILDWDWEHARIQHGQIVLETS